MFERHHSIEPVSDAAPDTAQVRLCKHSARLNTGVPPCLSRGDLFSELSDCRWYVSRYGKDREIVYFGESTRMHQTEEHHYELGVQDSKKAGKVDMRGGKDEL